jgi:cyanophycinase-like exopeptidase
MALLGSGEFEPWTEEVDRWLLDRASGDGSVLILPAASAPEGDEVFNRWAEMGLRHYEGLGIPAEVLQLKTKDDAQRADMSSRLDEASVAYFSGGNPAYLAAVLREGSSLRSVPSGVTFAATFRPQNEPSASA